MKRHLEALLVSLLPVTIYRTIGGIYGYIIPAKKSYSQYGEDLVIENFFKTIGRHTGVYVDVGAFHPRWLSNTHLLSQSGWSGSVVDIDEHKVALFQKTRNHCQGIVSAVFPRGEDKEAEVYRFRRLWSELDTLSLKDAQEYESRVGIKFDASKVSTISINEVLSKTVQRFGSVNFINIDIEGLDEAILMEINFMAYKPELICFENNEQFAGTDKVRGILLEKGYIHLFTSGGTHGYCLKSSLNV